MERLRDIERNQEEDIIITNFNKMKVLKWFILSLILFTIGVKFYLTFVENVPFYKDSFLVLLLIIILMLKRGRVFWWLGILMCIYGLYNLIFISSIAAEPTCMEFTSSVSYLFFKNKTGFWVRYVIKLIPLFFYLFYLFYLLSKRGREHYFDKSMWHQKEL